MTNPAGVTLRDVFNAMEAMYKATPRNKPFRLLSVAQRAKLETEVMAVFDSLAGSVVVPRADLLSLIEVADRNEYHPAISRLKLIAAAVDGGA